MAQTTVTPTLNDSDASYVVKIDNVRDSDGTVSLVTGENHFVTVVVTADDGYTTKTYKITVWRSPVPAADTGELDTDDPELNFRVSHTGYHYVNMTWSVPDNRGIAKHVLQRFYHDGTEYVQSGESIPSARETTGGRRHTASSVYAQPSTHYKFVLTLKDTSDTAVIVSSVTTTTPAAPSRDTSLSSLMLNGIDLGTFDPATTSYDVDVANDVTQTTVTPSLNDSNASYVIKRNGRTDLDGTFPLGVGQNTITVVVTAEDGYTTEIYAITVTRARPAGTTESDDATLINLVLLGFDFGIFSPNDASYVTPVRHGLTQTTVIPTTNDPEASYVIKLDDVTDTDGVISLAVGSNVITVVVTARDGQTTKSYSVDVDRAGLTPSTDATLSTLTLSGVDFGTFAPTVTTYSARVANSLTQTMIAPTVNHLRAGYDVYVNGDNYLFSTIPLGVGANTIEVRVRAEDYETFKTYTVTVTRADASLSTDATLDSLTLSNIDFGTFDPANTSYTVEVENDVTETTVTPTVNHTGAVHVITLDGLENADGEVSLQVGENVIAVRVTAEDGTTTATYTVAITRKRAPDPERVETCLQSVDSDGAIDGSWDDTCLSERDASGGAGDRYSRYYTFTLKETTDLVISLSSQKDSYLYILVGHGKDGKIVYSNDDIESGVDTDSRLSVTLHSGDYTIEATTYAPVTTGDFTLSVEGLLDTCVESVDADGTIDGSWDDTCVSDRDPISGTGDRYSRFYTFTLDKSSKITLTLKSVEDTYLYLLEGHGRGGDVLYEEDDIEYGVDTNSLLSESLDAGDYTIEATTYYAEKSGDFALEIEGLAATQ